MAQLVEVIEALAQGCDRDRERILLPLFVEDGRGRLLNGVFFVYGPKLFLLPGRAVPHSKAQLAGCGATPQLMDLALSGPSIRRKRHESVMSIVMGSGLKR